MRETEELSQGSRGKVIRPAQFHKAPEQNNALPESATRIQIKVSATSERLEQKIIRFITTELRSAPEPILVTNKDPAYRVLINAVETSHPPEIFLAVVATAVLDMSAILDIDLTEARAKAWNLSDEQTKALRKLFAGADLHHMALAHGLRIMYSSGHGRTIEPYESILSLQAWKAPPGDLSGVLKELVAEFEADVLNR